jgi:phosphatidylglycerophosphate synthase
MPERLVLAATRAEAPGANLRIAGLRLVDRAIKQLGLAPATRAIVATDGSVPLPATLPANMEVRNVPDPPAAAALAGELQAPVLGADIVRIDRGRLDGMRVADASSLRAAEDALYGALFRPDLGFVARRFNKPLSTRVTRHLLVRTPITPNQITLFAAALGVLGCALIVTGQYWMVLAGMALEHVQSVLDGCDGELARVRLQQSKFGAWMDTFVDDVLNVLITAAVGVGMWQAGWGKWALWVGIAGAAMLVVSNVVIMADMRRQKATGDLMDMVWWFSGGKRLADLPAGDGRPSIGTFLFQLGRRDTALLLWVGFVLINQLILVQIMATIIALAWFVASVVQLIVRPAGAAR